MLKRKNKTVISAQARQQSGYVHTVFVRDHLITVDESEEVGGNDLGPTPMELLAASLASCTAVTMEMYAQRKGWSLSGVEVKCDYEPVERGAPTRFSLVIKMPRALTAEQIERLSVIAAKCPIHRTLEGEVYFDERIELA